MPPCWLDMKNFFPKESITLHVSKKPLMKFLSLKFEVTVKLFSQSQNDVRAILKFTVRECKTSQTVCF